MTHNDSLFDNRHKTYGRIQMKKILLSTISLIAFTGVASAATNEELLQENKALKAEIAALRAKAYTHNGKVAKNYSNTDYSSALPNIKGQPTVSPAPLWTGFYAGLNAGYGFGTANNAQQYGWADPAYQQQFTGYQDSGAATFALAASYSVLGRNITQGGFIGGGQVGYNYQYGQSTVIGFEADIQGSGISGEGSSNGAALNTHDNGLGFYSTRVPIIAGINWMGTARGRVGYLVTPTVLLYATGGLAYGGTYLKTYPTSYDIHPTDWARPHAIWTQNSQQNLNVGWTAGGGFEWMVMPNWSIKGEALYYDLGNTSVSNLAYSGGYSSTGDNNNMVEGGFTTRAYYQGVIARAGVNYHFNLGAMPVVAKF